DAARLSQLALPRPASRAALGRVPLDRRAARRDGAVPRCRQSRLTARRSRPVRPPEGLRHRHPLPRAGHHATARRSRTRRRGLAAQHRRRRGVLMPAWSAMRAVARAAALATLCAAAAVTVPSAGAPRFRPDDPLRQEVVSQDASGATPFEVDLSFDLLLNLFANPGDPDLRHPAGNVNTLGEVPDGPWFVNRAGTVALTPEAVARGPAEAAGPAPGRWTVIAANTDRTQPGFTIRVARVHP